MGLFWNGTIFVWQFLALFQLVPFLFWKLWPFSEIIASFLLLNFRPFLERSHFYRLFLIPFERAILALSKMVPFLLAKFGPFLKCYHLKPPFYWFPRSKGGSLLRGLRGLNKEFSNGTIFVEEFGSFKMVPFLLAKFGPFLKWYHFKPHFY